MNNPETPTPRTEAALKEIQVAFVGFEGTSSAPEKWIEPDFARELERELAAVKQSHAVANFAAGMLNTDKERLTQERDDARALLQTRDAVHSVARGITGAVTNSVVAIAGAQMTHLERDNAALREANAGLSKELGASQLEANALREQVRVLREAINEAGWFNTDAVVFDDTVVFGHGYDFFGLESLRRELHFKDRQFLIWPNGTTKGKWSLYDTKDGGMWFEKFDTEEAAKNMALAQIIPTPEAVASELAELREAKRLLGLIVSDLPASRDWLDPHVEAAARKAVSP